MSLILVPLNIIVIINIHYVARNHHRIALHFDGHSIAILIVIVDLIVVVKVKLAEIFEVSVSLGMNWHILLLVKGRQLVTTSDSACFIINDEISRLKCCLVVILCQGLFELWIKSGVWISPFKDMVLSILDLS
jgi:hypothetical protein